MVMPQSVKRGVGAVAIAVLLPASLTPVAAADLAGYCCGDLDERIASLEATAARKGNRKVSLSVSGHVNKALLYWDDGHESNAYVVGNKNDQTAFAFTGEAKVSNDVTVGYDLTLRLRDTLSDDVDQFQDSGTGDNFQLWQSHWWAESATLGKLSIGLASRVSDTVPENDLSDTAVAAYAGVQDMGGGFLLRTKTGGIPGLAWGDLYSHLNGDTFNLVRYDTPSIAGFVASASWGEDDIWDIGLRFEGTRNGVEISASVAFTEVSDTDGAFTDIDHHTLVGSVAILHKASGLNALVSMGLQQFDATAIDADGNTRTPRDAEFIYAKLGWIAQLVSVGSTAFYAEYAHSANFVSVVDDAALVAALDTGASAVRIAGSDADVWGFGVVQNVDAADMQLYLAYRRQTAEFSLRDAADQGVRAQSIEAFDTIVAGSKIAF